VQGKRRGAGLRARQAPGRRVRDSSTPSDSKITDVGVSFGGGCYFENGVGEIDGSGTFTLNTFEVE
jgi:hypothetical protein